MLRRIWNGRASGLPSMAMIALRIALNIIHHRLATTIWRGNLGAVGVGSTIQAGTIIRYPGNVFIGNRTSIARGVRILSELQSGALTLGSNCSIDLDAYLDHSGTLKIGDNVVISERVSIYTHSHGTDPRSAPVPTPLEIEDGVWIGAGATVLEGVGRIGKDSVVGAGAVVTREVPAETVVAGVPGKCVKSLPAKRVSFNEP